MNVFSGMGRLVADPELKTLHGDLPVCSFRIAINRRFKNKQTNEYDADFLPCVAWRQTAEFIAKYFSKGSMIGVVGSVQTRSWDADDGTKRYATEILVEQAHFTGSKSDSQPNYSQPGHSQSNHSQPAKAPAPAGQPVFADGEPIDLPFDI